METRNTMSKGVPISLDNSTKAMLRANAPAASNGIPTSRRMPSSGDENIPVRPMQPHFGTAVISKAAITGQMEKVSLHPTATGSWAMPDAAEMIYGAAPDEPSFDRAHLSEESEETVPKIIDGLLTGTVLLATVLVPFAIVNALVPRVREIMTELPFWSILVCATLYLAVTFAIAMAIAAAFGCGPIAHAKARGYH